MREIPEEIKALQSKEGDACLNCGARVRSVVTGKVVRTRHGQSAEVSLIGVFAIEAESSARGC